MKKIIDLFSGCGGFALGFHRAGYQSFLAADFDKSSCVTFKKNIKSQYILHSDITSNSFKKELKKICANKKIDGVIAGLPCQSFSSVGKAQDPNSMKKDKRNFLYKDFFECIKIIQPSFFVFENVRGILSSKVNGIKIFDEIKKKTKLLGYCSILNNDQILFDTSQYQIPQVRKRVFFIGVKNEKNKNNIVKKIYDDLIKVKKKYKKIYNVKDAIYDLPKLNNDDGFEKINYKFKYKNSYLKKINQRKTDYLFNHKSRKHNEKDRERYKILSKIKGQLIDLKKLKPQLIHHNPEHFKNRYTVQFYDKPSRTIVSHLYKDGNLFIHPDYKQQRTLTVREAARLQSFPDNFEFCGSRTDQYKQVGNAVPPLMSFEIAKSINKFIK